MQLPARLGKYELIEFLGGGMSHVYRAKDTVIGRTVAVKILTPEGCADSETKERFLQEARMTGNISHDNIISIYDFGEDQGRPFLRQRRSTPSLTLRLRRQRFCEVGRQAASGDDRVGEGGWPNSSRRCARRARRR
jgi:serine/threonine protein kinase